MIKCHIDNEKRRKTWATVNGTPKNLVTEIGVLIGRVYQTIKRKYPTAAQEFKNNLIVLLLAPGSPVWEEEDHGV